MDKVDAILYINLLERIDRKEHLLNELSKLNIDMKKVHRIDAIHKNPGALGASLSHIKSVEYMIAHPEWNNCLILEDDFTFKQEDVNSKLNSFFANFEDFDACVLSHNYLQSTETTVPFIKKVKYTQTASSYLISKKFAPKLLENFQQSTDDMIKNGRRHENCIDIYWSKLQPLSNWYAVVPSLGYQYESYSDIEKKIVNYMC